MSDLTATAWLAAARSVHFGACLLLFAVWFFDRFIAAPVDVPGAARTSGDLLAGRRTIARRLALLALPAALASGVLWFVIVAAEMGDLPLAQALDRGVLGTVWSKTHLGSVSKFRLICWLGACIGTPPALYLRPGSFLCGVSNWVALIASALLLGSLAWVGHGQIGPQVGFHLAIDTIHLLGAGCWPAGLLPFSLLFSRWKRMDKTVSWGVLADLTHRFSAMSLACVMLLGITGLANAWLLLGGVSDLWTTPYGRWLLLKIALFGAMAGLGAINLLYCRPRIAGDSTRTAATGVLEFNVKLEIALTTLVIVVVAILGVLPPGSHPG